MRHALPAALVLITVVEPTYAASLDDHLGGGYVALAQTSVVGAYSGCRPGRSLDFADGSHFICGKTVAQATNDPRV
jgi:hypothetical protein